MSEVKKKKIGSPSGFQGLYRPRSRKEIMAERERKVEPKD
jgi:hypothetical protein